MGGEGRVEGNKGEKWDNCNSIINKYIKKEDIIKSITTVGLKIDHPGTLWQPM